MQITEQFGMNKSLDFLFQLIYVSTNLFSSFEFQNEIGFFKIAEEIGYSKSERYRLLSYFLDLIEFFSMERIHLVQDPEDEFSFTLTGFAGGL